MSGCCGMAKVSGRPTELELEILKTLWERGPSTVREVLETLVESRRVGYTTALKMLQIMEGKGLVECDRTARAHVYRARQTRRATLAKLAGDVLERVFDGSMPQLVLHALDRKQTTPQELADLRRLLDEVERSG
jgi:BlaI family penicillinase repressor